MDRYRVVIAILLSMLILIGWPVVMRQLYPPPPPEEMAEIIPPAEQGPAPQPPAAPGQTAPGKPATTAPQAVTQAAPRDITIETPLWNITLSNRGAVATSWILKKSSVDGREILAANGGPLELIPQEVIQTLGAPLRLNLPWSPALEAELNQAYFQVEGVSPDEGAVRIEPGQSRQITFTYASPTVTARKTYTFRGDSLIFDATADVTANGGQQPVEIVLGPRIGDQSDFRTGSYATPPQVIAYTNYGERETLLGGSITPPFAQIVAIDPAANRIVIDKPLAGDVDTVKIVGGDEQTFIGYAQVKERGPDSRALTLDHIPQGASVGSGVAQGTDTLRQGYRWVGIADHYFTMTAVPPQPVPEIALTDAQFKIAGQETPHSFPSVAVPIYDDQPTRIFVGPKDRELLAEISRELNQNLEALLDYGIFAFMIRPLIPALDWALDGLTKLFHNYGWAIVAVTVVINLALSPLRYFSSKKMKKAAKHQPRMRELQERLKKLKENPRKNEREMLELQREQMALMKEANPLGGCLPLLLQMPIFWAFFIYLTVSLDVRHAPWALWIKDLSTPDPYYVLPIIMCVTMIASTAFTPQPASDDPAMKMQRVMMTWLMPIMLTWLFFFSAPSGLVLYWMVSNVVGVAIQLVINKVTAEPPPETPEKKGPGGKKLTLAGAEKGSAARDRKVSGKEVVGSVK
ncbi:MAG TPA: membrane protein insertase YidC [Blastocatellia bacterium]|nr:membrane protein insertase YidC [Blastocatellia bacterium]